MNTERCHCYNTYEIFFVPSRSRTMRGRLVILLCVTIVPLLMVVFGISYRWLQIQYQTEFEANLELARAISLAFKAYVGDVIRQEKAVGTALTHLKPYSSEQAKYLLKESLEEYHSVKRLSWANTDGRIVISSEPKLIGLDISYRPFYREIVKGKETVLSDLVQSDVNSAFNRHLCSRYFGR